MRVVGARRWPAGQVLRTVGDGVGGVVSLRHASAVVDDNGSQVVHGACVGRRGVHERTQVEVGLNGDEEGRATLGENNARQIRVGRVPRQRRGSRARGAAGCHDAR